MPTMRLGVHVPIAGGLLEAVARAKRLCCSTMQIFSRSPRGGPAAALAPETLAAFDAARRAADIEPLAVHAPYIINLASPQPPMWAQSLRLYREEYERARRLGARYLVTHVGSHRGSGESAGIARVADAVARTLQASPAAGVMILLENTAGSGQGLGYRFEQLAAIRQAVPAVARHRVGICLDTAHLFAAGYPIHTAEGLPEVLAAFDRAVGLERLQLIHLNDSKVPFDARVDRHWHIGRGHIGLDAFRRLISHPRLRALPFILETPKTTDAEDRRNLRTVRGLIPPPVSPADRRGSRGATRATACQMAG
jgi:deoxyribonuclease-4